MTDLIVLLSNRFENVNLFDLMGDVNTFPFLSDSETLQIMLDVEYGHRIVASQFINMSNEKVAKYLIGAFGDKWGRLIVPDFDLLSGNVQIIDETGNHSEDVNNANEMINKISAYNDDSLIDDGGSVSNGKNNIVGKNDKLTKISQQNLAGYWDNLAAIEKINIRKIVCYDIAKSLTLSIN